MSGHFAFKDLTRNILHILNTTLLNKLWDTHSKITEVVTVQRGGSGYRFISLYKYCQDPDRVTRLGLRCAQL